MVSTHHEFEELCAKNRNEHEVIVPMNLNIMDQLKVEIEPS